jgi:hypothetical protein
LAAKPRVGRPIELRKTDFIACFQMQQVDEHQQVLCNVAQRTSGAALRGTMSKVALSLP